MEGEDRQQQHQQQIPQLMCPRCQSTDTKFSYFNNYTTSQPRYFCKTCRRYWTHGGMLRNIPYGGGVMKERRSKTSSSATSSGRVDEILRTAMSMASPACLPLSPGSVSGGPHNLHFSGVGLKLGTQNLSRPQSAPNTPQHPTFTRSNHLSLSRGFSFGLNRFVANPDGKGQGQGQGQGQNRSNPISHLYRMPVEGYATQKPAGHTGLWTPPIMRTIPFASSSATATSYPSLSPNTAYYWNNSSSTIGSSSDSSSNYWFGQLPGYVHFP